jgi:polar amino acid transport system substrate-binding protein
MKQIVLVFLLLIPAYALAKEAAKAALLSQNVYTQAKQTPTQTEPTVVKWGTDVWPNYTDRDGTGFYHELLSAIYSEPEYSLRVEYFPWQRTLKNLATGEIDLTGSLPKSASFYQSKWPVINEDINVVSLNDEAINSGYLSSNVGAYRAGYEDDVFYAALPKSAKGVPVESAEQALALLKKGKVDYFVDLRSIIIPLMDKEQTDQGSLVKVRTIGRYKLYWSFVYNEQGKRLKRHFDDQIEILRSNGVLQSMYEKYNLELPVKE